jgi:hypothetical protein
MFATAQAALGRYRGLVYYGLPLDYYNTYGEKVAKVNEAQVKESATRHLRLDQTVYVVVGDGDSVQTKGDKHVSLREALSELAASGGVGPGGLVELDVDGKPIH